MDSDSFSTEEYKEYAKEIDESYRETFEKIVGIRKEDFNATSCIGTMTKFKTEQVACLIGDNISDYDKKILAGVIERHIAGVVFKG